MFKIEVQADSIPRLAAELLALGAQLSIPPETGLQRTVAAATATMVSEAEPTRRTRGPNKPKPEPEVEAAAEKQPEPKTESMVAAEEVPEVQATEEPESAIVAAEIDFLMDVQPKVLDCVARKGRGVVTGILDQFGATRASEVDRAQWPELIARLEEAVGWLEEAVG